MPGARNGDRQPSPPMCQVCHALFLFKNGIMSVNGLIAAVMVQRIVGVTQEKPLRHRAACRWMGFTLGQTQKAVTHTIRVNESSRDHPRSVVAVGHGTLIGTGARAGNIEGRQRATRRPQEAVVDII